MTNMLGFGHKPPEPTTEKKQVRERVERTTATWQKQKPESDRVLMEVERVQRLMEGKRRHARPH